MSLAKDNIINSLKLNLTQLEERKIMARINRDKAIKILTKKAMDDYESDMKKIESMEKNVNDELESVNSTE